MWTLNSILHIPFLPSSSLVLRSSRLFWSHQHPNNLTLRKCLQQRTHIRWYACIRWHCNDRYDHNAVLTWALQDCGGPGLGWWKGFGSANDLCLMFLRSFLILFDIPYLKPISHLKIAHPNKILSSNHWFRGAMLVSDLARSQGAILISWQKAWLQVAGVHGIQTRQGREVSTSLATEA